MNDNETCDDQINEKLQLSEFEIRVLGCLIEKEMSTPEYYPLTLNSLMAACNQKSNRDPVMLLDDKEIIRIIEDLRYERQLVRQVSSAGSRTPKYKHMVVEEWAFSPQEMAVICELFVRGPQTAGQLRTHCTRLFSFADISAVESALSNLVEHEDGPFVIKLPREPGCREQRWAHLFSGEIDISQTATEPKPEPARLVVQAENERIATLESEVAELKTQLSHIVEEFAEFRKQFE